MKTHQIKYHDIKPSLSLFASLTSWIDPKNKHVTNPMLKRNVHQCSTKNGNLSGHVPFSNRSICFRPGQPGNSIFPQLMLLHSPQQGQGMLPLQPSTAAADRRVEGNLSEGAKGWIWLDTSYFWTEAKF